MFGCTYYTLYSSNRKLQLKNFRLREFFLRRLSVDLFFCVAAASAATVAATIGAVVVLLS